MKGVGWEGVGPVELNRKRGVGVHGRNRNPSKGMCKLLLQLPCNKLPIRWSLSKGTCSESHEILAQQLGHA